MSKYAGLVLTDSAGRMYKYYIDMSWKLLVEDLEEQRQLMLAEADKLKSKNSSFDIRFAGVFETYAHWADMDIAREYYWAAEHVADILKKIKYVFKVRQCSFSIWEKDGYMVIGVWCGSKIVEWSICDAKYWQTVYVNE